MLKKTLTRRINIDIEGYCYTKKVSMLFPFRYVVPIIGLLSLGGIYGQEDDKILTPIVDLSARIKQHRFGASGQLVDGEEEMRKIIIQWNPIPGAISYDVCHNCRVLEDSTGPQPDEGGTGGGGLYLVNIDMTRDGRPAFVKSNTSLGKNTFHVRANLDGGKTTAWSQERIFNVNEPGNAVHEEL